MEHSTPHELYMRRCFDLARRGAGTVSPNPLVGAVLVHGEKVIGEGFHRQYGGAHAERVALSQVKAEDAHLIPDSRLYVSLEPCCHHGKTPPCTELILSSGIREVFISVTDPNPVVCGKGIAVLREHGVKVTTDILTHEGAFLIRAFQTSMSRKRPHVILKFVQSADGYIGLRDKQVWLSNEYERVMVHQLRSEVDAIMIGTNTAVLDNPELTTRHYPGQNPLRIIPDRSGRIPKGHHLFNDGHPTRVYTEHPERFQHGHLQVIQVEFDENVIPRILHDLQGQRIQSLLVEGGSGLINDFLKHGLWDEALVVRTPKILGKGIRAPLVHGVLKWKMRMDCDEIIAIAPHQNGIT